MPIYATPLPPPPVAQESAQVTVTISGTASQLTFFTNVINGNGAAAWAQIYSALTTAGINYVPGSLYINGVALPASARADIDVLIGVPIGVSFGILFLASVVAFRCFQKRKGAWRCSRRHAGTGGAATALAPFLPRSTNATAIHSSPRRRIGRALQGRQRLLLGFLFQRQIALKAEASVNVSTSHLTHTTGSHGRLKCAATVTGDLHGGSAPNQPPLRRVTSVAPR